MRLTYFNENQKTYEAKIYSNNGIVFRREGKEELFNDGIITTSPKYFASGFIIDALAEYENTGLTPSEIKELRGDTLRVLKQSNEILQKSNGEYIARYEKLLVENHKLKSLLKTWLEHNI